MTASAFVDREDILSKLSDAVDRLVDGSPKWIALIGPRRVGKTSVLLELARRRAEKGVLFLVLDLQEVEPVSREVWRWYASKVAEAFLGPELEASLAVMMKQPASFRRSLQAAKSFPKLSPSTRAFLNEIPDAEADDAFVRAAVALPEQLAKDLDLKILIAIDEFQELAQLESKRGAKSPFHLLRSVWQRHERTSYVISGSARAMLTELVTSKSSPFFLHFEVLEVGPFSRPNAIRLLVVGGIDEVLAASIADTLGGHPFYLQLMGDQLHSLAEPKDESALKAALQALVFSRTGRLALFFQNEHDRLVGRSAYLAATLDALAQGARRTSEIAERIRAASGDTSRYLERLGDAVEKHEDGYALADPVFSAWLRWRQPGGAVVPMSLIGDEAEKRVAQHLAELGFELVYQSRASRGAFDLLATRGSRQVGIQVKRTKLPLRFKKTEWRRMQADASRLGWSWVIAAVGTDSRVTLLDPAQAVERREFSVTTEASIEKILSWLDAQV